MRVDIYIRERNGNREIRIPWLPEKIAYESGGTTMASYDIADRGEVAVPTGSGLASFSWESQFPGKHRTDDAMLRGSWKEPKYYHNILEDWRASGEPLHLLVTGYPINADVFLEDYTANAAGGFGDWEYELTFLEDRDVSITTSQVSVPRRSAPSSSGQAYTIKSGDTLWGIAQKFYGAGSKWGTIYNANKDIIESTAKARWKAAGINRDSQNGHWIFAGTTITIP